ncbi:hypothetical protein UlMin_017110 [Ulmus minor]
MKQTTKPPLMASLLFLSILSLALTSATSTIEQACKATRYLEKCKSSLTQYKNFIGPNPDPIQILQTVIRISSDNLHKAQSLVKSILDSAAGSQNRTTAAKNCLEVLHNSDYRLYLANDALPRGRTKDDSRAWLSAALLYQYDCWSALKYANDTRLVHETMSFLDSLKNVTSNVLSMTMSYENFGNNTSSWRPPRMERDGFWEKESGSGGGSYLGTRAGFPSNITADATVCKDGSGGCYKTVQDTVNAAPKNVVNGKRFVIHIKEGVYEEIVRVPLEKKNMVFLGDGMGKTVITGLLNVGVLGDGFMASGVTFQNTVGPNAHQAVAFRSNSDESIIENCQFLGNQDTLYAHSLRQFYKQCQIQGNVDFIFGNSAAFFHDCQILVRPRQLNPEKGESNIVTAQGRTDPAQSTGFVFQNCLINGTKEYMKLYYSNPKVHLTYLGRPWKEFSRTVYIHCNLEAIIQPKGWMPWSGDLNLKTLFYGEFENSGKGSDLSKRVNWSSLVPAERVHTYSVQSFIQRR